VLDDAKLNIDPPSFVPPFAGGQLTANFFLRRKQGEWISFVTTPFFSPITIGGVTNGEVARKAQNALLSAPIILSDFTAVQCGVGEVDFYFWRIFIMQQLNLEWQKNAIKL
jgi:hypothetical protein